MPDTLGIGGKSGLARCPKCAQFIDSSSEVCRFCGSIMDFAQLQAAAAEQQKIIEEKSRANNRRALLAGIVSLLGTILAYSLWYGFSFWRRWRRSRP